MVLSNILANQVTDQKPGPNISVNLHHFILSKSVLSNFFKYSKCKHTIIINSKYYTVLGAVIKKQLYLKVIG